MRLISTFSKPSTLVSFASILAAVGPVIVVSAGFWDAVSHLQQEPEFFWSTPHIAVYAGVSLTACAAILGCILIVQRKVRNSLKTGIKLVIAGSLIQTVSGFGDSISHDIFGIDGLISWSHQPLEFGLVLASLGSVLIIKNRENTRLGLFLPFAIIAFLGFALWLAFNIALVFGHTIQCIPVYEIFSSGCAIL